ncbi:MAG: hypothetical protein ACRD21_15500, partial [Vicinamibacteria bacterium]
MWRGARLWGLAAILSVAGCDLPDGDMDPMNNDDVSRPEGAATRGGESSAARMPEGEHDMARARIESKSGSSVSG